MKPASLALAATLAILAGSLPSASAQTQDRTGAPTVDHASPDDHGNGNATTGSGHSDERLSRGDEDDASARGGNDDRQWTDRGPMVMPVRPAWPRRRMMMMGGAGAQFHFARGKARIDVTCSLQEDTQACVRAAGELIDKIAELQGAGRDRADGSAGRGDDRSNDVAPRGDDRDAPGERM